MVDQGVGEAGEVAGACAEKGVAEDREADEDYDEDDHKLRGAGDGAEVDEPSGAEHNEGKYFRCLGVEGG